MSRSGNFIRAAVLYPPLIDVQGALWVAHNYKEQDATSFAREAIEAAMDAYDSFRESGEHGAIFDAFGDPRDYWVRSTCERPDRVYPTKPIVSFLRGKIKLCDPRACGPVQTNKSARLFGFPGRGPEDATGSPITKA